MKFTITRNFKNVCNWKKIKYENNAAKKNLGNSL